MLAALGMNHAFSPAQEMELVIVTVAMLKMWQFSVPVLPPLAQTAALLTVSLPTYVRTSTCIFCPDTIPHCNMYTAAYCREQAFPTAQCYASLFIKVSAEQRRPGWTSGKRHHYITVVVCSTCLYIHQTRLISVKQLMTQLILACYGYGIGKNDHTNKNGKVALSWP